MVATDRAVVGEDLASAESGSRALLFRQPAERTLNGVVIVTGSVIVISMVAEKVGKKFRTGPPALGRSYGSAPALRLAAARRA
jgi:hypothetical protein